MNVRFLTPARTEVREIIAYYNQQRQGLGLEFAEEQTSFTAYQKLPDGVVPTFIKSSTVFNQ